jgi:hypothetical protein
MRYAPLVFGLLFLTGCSMSHPLREACSAQVPAPIPTPAPLAPPPSPPAAKAITYEVCDKKYVACFTKEQFAELTNAFAAQKNYSLTLLNKYKEHQRH